MASGTKRLHEILFELEYASHYFQRISTEKDFYELFKLPLSEQHIAQRIYENILSLHWHPNALNQRLH